MTIYAPRASAILFNFLKSNYRGGYYLLPVNICPIVPLVFRKANVDFKVVDIDSETLCIDRKKVLEHIDKSEFEGLLFVYTYGIEIQVDNFFKKLKQKNRAVKIIEDKCLMKPSFDFENASYYADLTLYSTGYSKYIDLDYGGFGISHHEIAYKLHKLPYNPDALKNMSQSYKRALEHRSLIDDNEIKADWLENDEFSWNKDEYEMVIKKKIQEVEHHKSEINSVYQQKLPSHIIIDAKNSFCWRFNIRVPRKEKLLNDLFRIGLFASSHYQRVDGILSSSKIEAPVASRLQEQVVNLFNDKNYTVNQAFQTCDVISNHLAKYAI